MGGAMGVVCVAFGLAALADEGHVAHGAVTYGLTLLGAWSRAALVATLRGLVLFLALLLGWAWRLLTSAASASVEVLAELVGAQAYAEAARNTASSAAANAAHAADALHAHVYAAAAALLPYALALAGVCACALVVRARVLDRRRASEARRYVSADGWLRVRLKQPLDAHVHLARLLPSHADAPPAVADDLAEASLPAAAPAGARAPLTAADACTARALLDELEALHERAAALISATAHDATDGGVAERRTLLGRHAKAAHEALAWSTRTQHLGRDELVAAQLRFGYADGWRWQSESAAWRWPWQARVHASHAEHDLSFEAACAAYNLGAALSLLAACQPAAVRAATLEHAAGALDAVATIAASAHWTGFATADLRADALAAMQCVLLAQVILAM
jgi:hypothetical protein